MVSVDGISSEELLKVLLQKMYQEGKLKVEDLLNLYQEASKEVTIPISIFSYNLHPQEAVCKYLRENEGMSNPEIAKLLKKDGKSTWATYKRAKKKRKQKFLPKEEKYRIPISLFQNQLSFLENVVKYLRVHLPNKKIAKLLNKSANSIAVLAKRAREKDAA